MEVTTTPPFQNSKPSGLFTLANSTALSATPLPLLSVRISRLSFMGLSGSHLGYVPQTGDPQAALGVDLHLHRVDQRGKAGLVGEKRDLKAVGNLDLGEALLRGELALCRSRLGSLLLVLLSRLEMTSNGGGTLASETV